MFNKIKKQVQENLKKLSTSTLFYVTIDRDKIWEVYLNGFPESEKQHYNCNCCKSFLRQYGGIVGIENGKIVSIWDNITPEPEFGDAISNLNTYIHSLPITDVFYNEFKKCGTEKNLDKKTGGIWEHFYIELDNKFIVKNNIDSKRAEKRDDKAVLKRSLDELTLDSVDTVLELIAQGSLYRGNEFKGLLDKFKLIKIAYNQTKENKDTYTWNASINIGQALCRIRNTSIGTLLIDLSEGVDLDIAVTKFEKVVAPTNYKRPTSLVTPKMVEQAKEKLIEMGLLDSMERRYANVADLNVENILYTDKSSELTDVFGEITKDTLVNPKTLSKLEEISITDFLEKIVPKSKSIEVLLENNHLNNFVSLITGQDKNAKSLFKWDNLFSWSYTGAIADSMKERVKAAGGKVDGVLRFSIQWNEDGKSIIDLDAHAHEPNKMNNHIYYGSGYRKDRGNVRTSMSGQLDVDMINPREVGIENIAWSERSKMRDGKYALRVHNYSGHRNFDGVRCEVEFDGELHEFAYNKPFTNYIDIAEVTLKNGKFYIETKLDSKSAVKSSEKWGTKTNTYTKVKQIMLSPNHWEKPIGNKHFMFILENCISDESPRPFFNEFLKEEFNENRKVFEILGSKVKVPDSKQQLSGVGFSETQRNSLIVRVEGTFKRNLKINF